MTDALVKQRYTYVGELVVEVVVAASEGSISTEVNVLPGVSPSGAVSQTGNMPPALETPVEPNPVVAASLVEPPSAPDPGEAEAEMTLAAAPMTPGQRTSKGVIRAMWTAAFSFGGEALVYGLNNLTALNLPPGLGLAVGAVGYGAKAAIFPNSKL